MDRRHYSTGDPVIFRKFKHSSAPGPRAKQVAPAPHGEEYAYCVDKFWTVVDVRDDGQLLVTTRRGKENVVAVGDPNLRPARWWERLLYRDRFPKLGDDLLRARAG